jgi:hypothetical protein
MKLRDAIAAMLGVLKPKREVTVQAYCMKCRGSREIVNPKQITMKNGRLATQGVCMVCRTKVFRIGKG